MKIELLPAVNLPEGQSVITCEGVKTCDKVSVKKEGSTGDLHLNRVGDELNCCRLMKVIKEKKMDCNEPIDKEEKMDCNELIAYWMMEGYLGHVDSVKEAYKKGHELFMDFKYVKMPRSERYEKEMFDSLVSDTTYKRYRSFFYSTLGLGFVDVFEDFLEEAPKFGKLVPDNGALRSLTHENKKKSSCLLLDGNQQGRHVLGFFNESLKHFAYFNPRANILQSALKPTGLNLSVLVLRGCDFLEEIDPCIGQMTDLTILEISHSSSINTIPDIFKTTTELRSLNLSYLAIKILPKNSFAKLVKLRWIILRGCSELTVLPSTRDMTQLKVIDLYGAKSLTKLSTTNFRKHHIKLIDLSNTHATRVPCLFDFSDKSTTITHLFLRNCLKIYVFDIVDKLVKLEVLDVSGSENLKQISIHTLEDLVVLDLSRTGLSSLKEDSFKNLKKLKVLNLSKTHISSMPDISCLSGLLRLTVQGCESLETLKLGGLKSLQFLDVSGCKKLEGLGEIDFGQWPSLLSLNLSDTCIENFKVLNPNAATSKKQDLEPQLGLLQNPNAASSSNQDLEPPLGLLQIPNAASSSNQDLEPPLGLLQMLDLSNTFVKELPSMSQFKSLKQLLLAGCSKLSSVPDLELLTKLEVLDLSGTKIKNELLQKAPGSLRKLLLKDCSEIEGPLPLASLTLLEELDLQGSNVAELPQDLAGMPNLKCLRLPHKMNITRVDWRRMKDLRLNELYWDQLNIFDESVKVLISSDTEQFMSVKPSNDSHLFRLVDNEDKWEGYFKQFQFSVSPKEENKDAEIHFGGVELVFKGHHPLARKAPYVKPQCPSVEIHGFSSFPEDTQSGLKQAVNVALVGNSFVSSLSDEYFKHMEARKVCWINSCTKMKSILGEDQNAGFWGGLETLVLSNLASLKSFSAKSENVPSQSTVSINLKHLYIDCCPVLDKIISTSHLPENLETLHIKFCDKLEDVCGGSGNTSTVGKEPEAAPGGSTSNVGDKPAAAPGGKPSNSGDVSGGSTSHASDEIKAGSSGNTSTVGKEPEAAPGGSTSNVSDKPVAAPDEKPSNSGDVSGGSTSHASDEIKAGSSGNTSTAGNEPEAAPGGSTSNVSDKPVAAPDGKLSNSGDGSGGSTSHVSEIEPASDGDKHDAVSGGKTSKKCSLPKLRELSLLSLPKLLRIGADLPFLQTLIISQCPELDMDIFGSILQCARSQLTRLSLDSCPKLKHVLSSSMLPEKLERLEIRSCDQLETVFDSAGPSSPSLRSLRHLQLWNLPQLNKIGGDFPPLDSREIKYCSRLPQRDWPKAKTQN